MMRRIGLAAGAAVCAVGLLLLAPGGVQAQTTQDAGWWFALFAQGNLELPADDPLLQDFKWWFDGHLRLWDDAGGYGQTIARPGIGRALTERSVVWLGYAYVHSSPNEEDEFDENRIWQQWSWTLARDPAAWSLRSRLEQRFVETGDDVGWRFRQLVRWQRTLERAPRLMLVGWNEVFLNFNNTDWGADSGFDQNRAFVGLGITGRNEGRWRTEIGYLNQFLEVPGRDDVNNHILSVNLYRNP